MSLPRWKDDKQFPRKSRTIVFEQCSVQCFGIFNFWYGGRRWLHLQRSGCRLYRRKRWLTSSRLWSGKSGWRRTGIWDKRISDHSIVHARRKGCTKVTYTNAFKYSQIVIFDIDIRLGNTIGVFDAIRCSDIEALGLASFKAHKIRKCWKCSELSHRSSVVHGFNMYGFPTGWGRSKAVVCAVFDKDFHLAIVF